MLWLRFYSLLQSGEGIGSFAGESAMGGIENSLFRGIIYCIDSVALSLVALAMLKGINRKSLGKHKEQPRNAVYLAILIVAWLLLFVLLGRAISGYDLTILLPKILQDSVMVFSCLLVLIGSLLWYAANKVLTTKIWTWNITATPLEREDLLTDGVYGYVRHPLYLAWIPIAAGVSLATSISVKTLLINALIWCALYLRAKEEERALKENFGEEYLNYKRRVPMFLPGLRRRPPLGNFRPHPNDEEGKR